MSTRSGKIGGAVERTEVNDSKSPLLRIALIGLSVSLLAACGETRLHYKNGIRGQKDENGNLFLQLRGHTFSDLRLTGGKSPNKEFSTEDVKLLLPVGYRPELSYEYAFFTFQLPYIKPLDPPPDFSPELEAQLRLYSRDRRNPDSLSNPETLRWFQDARQRTRMIKRVRLNLLDPAFATDRIRRQKYQFYSPRYAFGKKRGVITEIRGGVGTHLPDGNVAGLQRFSAMHCYSPSELEVDPQYPESKVYLQMRQNLKNKEADDPTPEGCRLDRRDSFFISPPSVPVDESVFIECHTIIWFCDIHFQAGRRAAVVVIDDYDVPLWREIIGPIRRTIDGFVVEVDIDVPLWRQVVDPIRWFIDLLVTGFAYRKTPWTWFSC